MERLASMYIDNEMDLAEKIQFVQQVSSDPAFSRLTIALLNQEKQLQDPSVLPAFETHSRQQRACRIRFASLLRPLGFTAAGFFLAFLLLFLLFDAPATTTSRNRFVFFEPSVEQVQITGTFTNWEKKSMLKIGRSGYWALTLPVESGEHRFVYILDGRSRIPDPTIPDRERDDFGGQNSILRIDKCL